MWYYILSVIIPLLNIKIVARKELKKMQGFAYVEMQMLARFLVFTSEEENERPSCSLGLQCRI